jgi:hypothetical protein
MAYIRHDSHDETTISNRQALGEDSPIETDGDGYAEVADDDTATLVAAMDSHISVETPSDTGEDEGYDPAGDDLEAKSYDDLRALASEYDDIDGRQSRDELTKALREREG